MDMFKINPGGLYTATAIAKVAKCSLPTVLRMSKSSIDFAPDYFLWNSQRSQPIFLGETALRIIEARKAGSNGN